MAQNSPEYRNGQYDSDRHEILKQEYDSQLLEPDKKEERLMTDLVRISKRLSYPLELTGKQHETTALVLVDFQNDYVRGPASCFKEDPIDHQVKISMLSRIAHLWCSIPFQTIVYVRHSHPPNSALFTINHQCSFKNETKYYPVHCLQGSIGAELASDWTQILGGRKWNQPPFGSYIYNVIVGTKRSNATLRQCPLKDASHINNKAQGENELLRLLRKHNTTHAFVCALNAEECGITTCASLQSHAISTYLVLDCSKPSMSKHNQMGEFMYKCIGKKPPRKEWKIVSSDELRIQMGQQWKARFESGIPIDFQEEDNPRSRKRNRTTPSTIIPTGGQPERARSYYRMIPMNMMFTKHHPYHNTIDESFKNFLIRNKGSNGIALCEEENENEERMEVDQTSQQVIKLDQRAKHWFELSSTNVPALADGFDFTTTPRWRYDLPKSLKSDEPDDITHLKLILNKKKNKDQLKVDESMWNADCDSHRFPADSIGPYMKYDLADMAAEILRHERELKDASTANKHEQTKNHSKKKKI